MRAERTRRPPARRGISHESGRRCSIASPAETEVSTVTSAPRCRRSVTTTRSTNTPQPRTPCPAEPRDRLRTHGSIGHPPAHRHRTLARERARTSPAAKGHFRVGISTPRIGSAPVGERSPHRPTRDVQRRSVSNPAPRRRRGAATTDAAQPTLPSSPRRALPKAVGRSRRCALRTPRRPILRGLHTGRDRPDQQIPR